MLRAYSVVLLSTNKQLRALRSRIRVIYLTKQISNIAPQLSHFGLCFKVVLLCAGNTVHIRSRRSVRPVVWLRFHDVHRNVRIRHRSHVAGGQIWRRSFQAESQVTWNAEGDDE